MHSVQYGITVSENGTILMNGKPFYAYGVNDYTMSWLKGSDYQYKTTFAILQKYGIPVVRYPAISPTHEQIRLYEREPEKGLEELLKLTDRVVAEAERCQIGLILCIFFNGMMAEGEKVSAIGDVNSKTLCMRRRFTRSIVSRYKNSPAIWGWDITNETNLSADIFNTSYNAEWYGPLQGEFNGYDSYTSEEGRTSVREIAKVIREVDDYRMISTGDAILRTCSRSLHRSSQKMDEKHCWSMDMTTDKLADFRYMLDYFNPEPIDTVSLHMGCSRLGWEYHFADGCLTFEALLKEYLSSGRSRGQALYFGEFGDCGELDGENAESYVKTNFPTYLETMAETGVQLATMWQFNGKNNEFTDEGLLSFMLEKIGEMNARFREQGLQDTAGMW